MGIGDWILATADARYYYKKFGKPVVFANPKTGKAQWSEAFKNNPNILKDPAPGVKCVVDRNHGSGHRPYHKGYDGEREQFAWNYDFKAEPGELFLSNEELQIGRPGVVLIEPNTKDAPLSRNKAWPFERWQALVDSLPLPWVQLGSPEAKTLKGVERVHTKSFRDALGWLNQSALLVTTDGALHHAAAALGKPAVVLWGGLVPPFMLGYDIHRNITHADSWCGLNRACEHCAAAMRKITVEEVREAILETSAGSLVAGRGTGNIQVPECGTDRRSGDLPIPQAESGAGVLQAI